MSSTIKSYIELCRVSNLPTVWTNVLAAAVLSEAAFSWFGFITLAFSMSLFYSAGMCLNDIFDVETDRVNKPFRPLPSGSISLRNAWVLTDILFAAGVILLLTFPYQRAVPAGVLLLVLIVIYDKYHKAHPFSVIIMASCRLMVYVVSSTAVSGEVGALVVVAGLMQFTYILAVSLAARYENKRKKSGPLPVIPLMIAGASLIDGIVLAIFASPHWLLFGISGTILTLAGQKFVKGD